MIKTYLIQRVGLKGLLLHQSDDGSSIEDSIFSLKVGSNPELGVVQVFILLPSDLGSIQGLLLGSIETL